MDHYYLLDKNKKPKGPYKLAQIRELWWAGKIPAETLCCPKGGGKWLPINQIPDIVKPIVASAQPPSPPAPPDYPNFARFQTPEKSYTNEPLYYLLGKNKKPKGPYKLSSLRELLEAGKIPAGTRCCTKGGKKWLPISQIPSVVKPIGASAPPPPTPSVIAPPPPTPSVIAPPPPTPSVIAPPPTPSPAGGSNFPQFQAPVKFFVNEPRFDNVGQILDRMGQGFEYESAERYTSVSPRDAVLFLNCGGSVNASPAELASFIESGGTIYASDLQAEFVATMFPSVFEYSTMPEKGVYNASVVDQALMDNLGNNIDLEFDLGFWQFLTPKIEAEGKAHVYLRARDELEVKEQTKNTGLGAPLVVSYDHPQGGSLFFTAFHNSAQKTKKEEELLRFLLFRPIMSRDLQEIRQDVSETISIHREYTGGLRKALPEKTYSLDASANWKAILSWTGQGKIALDFLSKDGTILKREEQWAGPTEIMADVENGGSVRVRCTEFVQSEIPFCLIVGSGDASTAH